MSSTTHTTDATAAHGGHGHGAHGGDHVPHVLPLAAYFGVFVALLIFTGITVAVSYVDLGEANLFIALLVATCKALMVGLIFMHLAFDKKFNAIIFISSVLFLAVFITFTMFDLNWRGLGGRGSADRPADITNPFAGTASEEAIKRAWTKSETGEVKAEGAGAEKKGAPSEGQTGTTGQSPAPAVPEGTTVHPQQPVNQGTEGAGPSTK